MLSAKLGPVSFAIALSLAGCVGVPKYSVALKNVGTATVGNAHVVYPGSGFRSAGGVLPPGTIAAHGSVPFAPPETAMVGWTAGDGAQHTATVEVRKLVPHGIGQDFCIFFEIGDNDRVVVRVERSPFEGIDLDTRTPPPSRSRSR